MRRSELVRQHPTLALEIYLEQLTESELEATARADPKTAFDSRYYSEGRRHAILLAYSYPAALLKPRCAHEPEFVNELKNSSAIIPGSGARLTTGALAACSVELNPYSASNSAGRNCSASQIRSGADSVRRSGITSPRQSESVRSTGGWWAGSVPWKPVRYSVVLIPAGEKTFPAWLLRAPLPILLGRFPPQTPPPPLRRTVRLCRRTASPSQIPAAIPPITSPTSSAAPREGDFHF
jgi:hypothetical protein